MKPISIFFIAMIALAAIFFLLPINFFDGEIVYENGLQVITDEAPLSLSYFIGLGYDPAEMENVKSFRLLPTGYLMAVVFIVCIPALIAYRIHISRSKNKEA
jgi:hypothetical protein